MNTAISAMKKYSNPLFVIDYSVNGSGVEVRLNDIPVISHNAQGSTSSQKQVPEYIIDGVNTVTIRTYPLSEDDRKYRTGAFVEITLSVKEENAPMSATDPLLHIRVNPLGKKETVLDGSNSKLGKEDIKIIRHSDVETVVERTVDIQSPFLRWAWQDGQVIENTVENFDSLMKKYREIYSVMKAEDKNALTKIYNSAAEEYAAAFNLTNRNEGHELMSTGELMGDDEWKLGNMDNFLEKFKYRLDIYGNGKLARVIDQKSRAPIIYLNTKVRLLNIQKFGFYKNKNGEWIMIR